MRLREWIKQGIEVKKIGHAIECNKDWYKEHGAYNRQWVMVNDKRGLRKLIKIFQSQDESIKEQVLLILVFHSLLENVMALSALRKCFRYRGSKAKEVQQIVTEVFNSFESDSTFSIMLYLIENISFREKYIDKLLTYDLTFERESAFLVLIYLIEHMSSPEEYIDKLLARDLSVKVNQELIQFKDQLNLQKKEAIKACHSLSGVDAKPMPSIEIEFCVGEKEISFVDEIFENIGIRYGETERIYGTTLSNGDHYNSWCEQLLISKTRCGRLLYSYSYDADDHSESMCYDIMISLPSHVRHVVKEALQKAGISVSER